MGVSKYRKKPIVVDAVQWFPDRVIEGVVVPVPGDGTPYIKTLEGAIVPVASGDWIITGAVGEHYPLKPDVFALTYEMVKE